MPERVLAIFGPTASGKTAVAEVLTRRIPAEVISADAAALFRGLEVLTAAPEYPARLVGVCDVEHDVSVGEYQRLARDAVDAVLAARRTPVVVGGTGLYFRAALADFALPPPPAHGERERWEAFYDAHGGVHAHGRLQALDPEAAARVHPNDRRRVVRALELAEAGSSLAGDALWGGDTRRPTLVFGVFVRRAARRPPRAAWWGVGFGVLGLVTVPAFWSGLPPVFGVAAIFLGRVAWTRAEPRPRAGLAAVVIGVTAILADVFAYATDVASRY